MVQVMERSLSVYCKFDSSRAQLLASAPALFKIHHSNDVGCTSANALHSAEPVVKRNMDFPEVVHFFASRADYRFCLIF